MSPTAQRQDVAARGPLPSIRIRYYQDSDSDDVRRLFKTALCVGADSPRHHLCRSQLKTPAAFASLTLFVLGTALYLSARTHQVQLAACLLLFAGTVPFPVYFARTYAAFMAFVNGSINAPDMTDVPKSYGMVRNAQGDLLPKGKNAFWVAEAYTPLDPSRVQVVGCVGLDITTSAGDNNAELRRLAVSSMYRGRGIARQLIKALITHAREHDVESVYLRTSSYNIGALSAYRKLGWVIQHEYVAFKNMYTHVLNLDVADSAL